MELTEGGGVGPDGPHRRRAQGRRAHSRTTHLQAMGDPLTSARWALVFRVERGDTTITRADLLQAGVTREMITLKEVKDMAKECARINSLAIADNTSDGISCLKYTIGRKIQMYLGLPYGLGAVP